MLDGIYVIAEIKDGDITNYIRGLTGIIYRKESNGTKTYYVTNNHGDVTALVNSSGTIVKEYTYDEYGVEANPDKEDTNPFRYCGEYFDIKTGFIYLRARYYDPELGRFISEDPICDSANWYVYCVSNPINFFDSFGLSINVVDDEYYKYLQSLTDDKLIRGKNGDVEVEMKAANIKRESGTGLIRELISSSASTIISRGTSAELSDVAGISKTVRNDSLNGYKTIYINIGTNFNQNVLVDQNGISSYEKTSLDMVIAHELCHAYNKVSNNIFEENSNYKYNENYYSYKDEKGNYISVSNKCKELQAIGLMFYVKHSSINNYYYSVQPPKYSENMIRAENGYARRLMH